MKAIRLDSTLETPTGWLLDMPTMLAMRSATPRELVEKLRVTVRFLTCVSTRTVITDLHAVGLVEGFSDGGFEGKVLGSPVGLSVVGA